jgi:hypothetical protein
LAYSLERSTLALAMSHYDQGAFLDQRVVLGSGGFPRMMSEAFSATMIVGAFVLHTPTDFNASTGPIPES